MTTFKIATWNVNSLRVRLSHVLTWLHDVKPDVLALQEIKVSDADFPMEAIEEAGYSAVISGQKTYNGVAILINKKKGIAEDKITDIPGLDDLQRRVLGVTINHIRVLNLYVPNGESVSSEKYQYKLNWLKKLEFFLQEELKKYPKIIILGDFNIAPDARDVHDPKQWEGHVLVSEPERRAFHDVLQLGFHDSFRLHHTEEKQFTWWDYRLNAYKRNMGLRIDHILVSTSLSSHCTTCVIDKAPRAWERPSDHVPVVAEFK